MKRCLAVLLSTMLLMTSVPMVGATYNDDQFDWGEYACPHAHTEEVKEIPSTCIQQGLSGYVRCADCHLLLSGTNEVLPLADHTYDHVCDADCNVCGAVRDAGHTYTKVVVAPDCVTDGYTQYICFDCGDEYVTDVISATGHDYRADVTTPDCENSGYTVHTCTVCGDSYADNRVDALGHDYRVTEDVLPTCVADGKKVYTCSRCGDSYTEVIPAHGQHTYAHMCDEKCDVCGYVRTDAHAYTYMGTVEPTCGEDGSDGYKCWECGEYMYVILPATGKHTYSGVCDADCNKCGFIRDAVTAHDYALTEDVAATCTTNGKQVYTCQGCGDSYTNTIVSKGHKYHIVITAPTCEQGGYTTHTCTVCGDVRVDNRTDALGHNYQLTEEVAPTCTQDGKKVYTCANCGDSYDEKIPAAGHKAMKIEGYPATCEKDGLTAGLVCSVCDYVRTEQRVIPALGHSYDDDADTDCNTCGAVREVIIRGDANGDGKVNNRDLGVLQKYLNELETAIDTKAADMDGNGKVNNRDLGQLQQHLNK